MNQLFKYIAIFLSFIALPASALDSSQITTQAVEKSDEQWFVREFPRSFMAVYEDKVFVITKDKQPTVLGPADLKAKQEWLLETAREEFQDYVAAPKEGYRSLLITYEGQPAGSLLYRLLEPEKTIYLAQYFILPEQQKKGIGYHILQNVITSLHPDYTRYEILARHQNDAAFLLYRKLGFSIGDIDLVKKYDYDPLRYIGFYKNLILLSADTPTF